MQNNDTTDSIVPVTHAAYAHVETVVAQADGNIGSSPLWHGWAVREAFEAGAAWQRTNGSTEAPLIDALEAIIKQYPNPNISHVDYRVHACRNAEQALADYRSENPVQSTSPAE